MASPSGTTFRVRSRRALPVTFRLTGPRGRIGVCGNSAAVNYKLAEAGALEPLSAYDLANLVHILPE